MQGRSAEVVETNGAWRLAASEGGRVDDQRGIGGGAEMHWRSIVV
ncbi:MAG: hypothetical protein ACLSFZ_05550 [Frisingicoccus sp.]